MSDIKTALLWAREPVEWVRAMFEVNPTPQQKELLDGYAEPGAKVTVRSGHGTGKTGGLAWIILHFLTFMNVAHDPTCLNGDTKVACTAPSGHQLMDLLWPEVMKWLGKMRPPFASPFRQVGEEIRYLTGKTVAGKPEARVAVARTSRKENPEALQGFHATNLLFLIDEASGVPDEVYEVAEGALSTPMSKVIMTSNPTKVTGYFYNSHHGQMLDFKRLHFSCLDSPLVSQAYIDNMLKKYGENSPIYQVRVLGNFPKANANSLIAMEWVQQAYDREDMEAHGECVAALDVGRGGDPSALVIRKGRVYTKVLRWYTDDTMEIVGHVFDLWKDDAFETLYVDSVGVGGPVADRLRQKGVPTFDVNVAQSASFKGDKYMRLRDQLWWEMRDKFHDGVVSIARDACDPQMMEDFFAELTILEYGLTTTNKIKVESKDDLKKRLGKYGQSPNMADAAMMCEAAGAVGIRQGGGKAKKREVKRVVRHW